MSNALISFFIAAGVAAFAYSKMGQRVGYGNAKAVWQIVVISFVLSFLVVFVVLKTLITLN